MGEYACGLGDVADGVWACGDVVPDAPAALLPTDCAAMLPLPPVAPPVGLTSRVRLGRDYYVRVDTPDYSVDPRLIGRFVDITATLDSVTVVCDGQVVAAHRRCWAQHAVIIDPAHAATAKAMRRALAVDRQQRQIAHRHADGHPVALRVLPDYDALFSIDVNPTPDKKKTRP